MFLKSLCPSCRHIVDNLITSKILLYNSERIDQLVEQIVSSSGLPEPHFTINECVDHQSDQINSTIKFTSEFSDEIDSKLNCDESIINSVIDDVKSGGERLEDSIPSSTSDALMSVHTKHEKQMYKSFKTFCVSKMRRKRLISDTMGFYEERETKKRKFSDANDTSGTHVKETLNKNAKMIASINILRLPNFMIDCDAPASELDQIYSSFNKSILLGNKGINHFTSARKQNLKLTPIKINVQTSNKTGEVERMKPSNKDHDFLPNMAEDIGVGLEEGRNRRNSSSTKQHELEPLDEVEEMNRTLGTYFGYDIFERKEFNQFAYMELDRSIVLPADELTTFDVLNENENLQSVAVAKTKKNKKHDRDKKIFRCPYCEYKCKPGGRVSMMRHLNAFTRKGGLVPPRCRKRKEVKPADPETGLYERLEPILIETE